MEAQSGAGDHDVATATLEQPHVTEPRQRVEGCLVSVCTAFSFFAMSFIKLGG
jgi:hypothetical protein